MIVHPSQVPAGRSVAVPVSTRDVPATILDLVGLEGNFPGKSLARAWADAPAPAEPVLATVSRSAKLANLRTNAPARLGTMFALILDDLKLIRNGDGRDELYDLATDPEEARDLADSPNSAADLARLREHLGRLTTTDRSPN